MRGQGRKPRATEVFCNIFHVGPSGLGMQGKFSGNGIKLTHCRRINCDNENVSSVYAWGEFLVYCRFVNLVVRGSVKVKGKIVEWGEIGGFETAVYYFRIYGLRST